MKLFLSNLCKFFFPIFLIFLLFVFCNYNYNFIASPMITNSYSLNEKLYRLPYGAIDIIAIGSSMTLNNLYSKSIINKFTNSSYYNLSSWGLRFRDVNKLMPIYVEMYHPKRVIIVSNVIDFTEQGGNKLDPSLIKRYLISTRRKNYILTNFNLNYLINRSLDNRYNLIHSDVYSSLKYDEYGGVVFQENDFKISQRRWGNKPDFTKIVEINYVALAELCSFLKEKKIKLIFIQSPLRDELVDGKYIDALQDHRIKVKKIVLKSGHVFVDTTVYNWPSKYFVDSVHLSNIGSRRLTNIFLNEVK